VHLGVDAERFGLALTNARVQRAAVTGRDDDGTARMLGADEARQTLLERRRAVVGTEVAAQAQIDHGGMPSRSACSKMKRWPAGCQRRGWRRHQLG
jgi:hypothetical protein